MLIEPRLRLSKLQSHILQAIDKRTTYGYRIALAIQNSTDGLLKYHGQIYPALARLEIYGHLHSTWSFTPSPRKHYALTAIGRRTL